MPELMERIKIQPKYETASLAMMKDATLAAGGHFEYCLFCDAMKAWDKSSKKCPEHTKITKSCICLNLFILIYTSFDSE